MEELKIVAIDFRDWCTEKQQPNVRNGFQGLTTEELWDEYVQGLTTEELWDEYVKLNKQMK